MIIEFSKGFPYVIRMRYPDKVVFDLYEYYGRSHNVCIATDDNVKITLLEAGNHAEVWSTNCKNEMRDYHLGDNVRYLVIEPCSCDFDSDVEVIVGNYDEVETIAQNRGYCCSFDECEYCPHYCATCDRCGYKCGLY